MSAQIPPVATAAPPSWNADVVYSALGSSVRRRLLFALVAQAGQSATMLKDRVGMTLDGTLKHLVELRNAGLVVMKADPNDARRQLYSVAPSVPMVRSESGTTLEFGFCTVKV